jgi:hypothetical protein
LSPLNRRSGKYWQKEKSSIFKVCRKCTHHSRGDICAFSCYNKGGTLDNLLTPRLQQLAADVLQLKVADPTGGANMYYATDGKQAMGWPRPWGDPALYEKTVEIENHTFFRHKGSCLDNYCNFEEPFDPRRCVTKAGITGDCRPRSSCPESSGQMRVEPEACAARFGHASNVMCCYDPHTSVRTCRTSGGIQGDCVDGTHCKRSGRAVEGDKCLGVGANGRPIQDHMSCCYNPQDAPSAPKKKPLAPGAKPWYRQVSDWYDDWNPFGGGTNM